jgi:hypothetical protein
MGPYFGYRPDVAADGDAATRRRTRATLALPEGPLVVGWGNEGWLDGPDVFVRVLWALRRRGLDVDGVWFGCDEDGPDAERLRSEAERCDVADHFHLRPASTRAARLCGDAVLCCDRSGGRSAEELIEAVVVGCPVVAFSTVDVVDDDVTVVPALDVEAAAEALGSLLTPGSIARREERGHQAALRLDICASLEELFALADRRHR